MSDINKVWISGVAVTAPVLTQLGSKTPFTTFILQVNEQFLDGNRNVRIKPNMIRVESLGKSAHATAEKVKQGKRYQVDGYLRQDRRDGQDDIRIRTFAVYREESVDCVNYNEGLKQALEVLKRSPNLQAAMATLEELMAPQ